MSVYVFKHLLSIKRPVFSGMTSLSMSHHFSHAFRSHPCGNFIPVPRVLARVLNLIPQGKVLKSISSPYPVLIPDPFDTWLGLVAPQDMFPFFLTASSIFPSGLCSN